MTEPCRPIGHEAANRFRFRTPVVCQNGHKGFYYFELSEELGETCNRRFDNFSGCPCPKGELGEGWKRSGPDEQSTGLLDKNGVEIFEGDIVASPAPCSACKSPHCWRWPIAWKRGKLVLDQGDTVFDPGALGPQGREVIGNIHANPELLK